VTRAESRNEVHLVGPLVGQPTQRHTGSGNLLVDFTVGFLAQAEEPVFRTPITANHDNARRVAELDDGDWVRVTGYVVGIYADPDAAEHSAVRVLARTVELVAPRDQEASAGTG
jgi:hypothetical protein